MQILAGSLNVEVESFLHAGYISAYPRTFQVQGKYYLASKNVKVIDVKKAVELKASKDQAALATAVIEASPTLPPAMMVPEVFSLVIAFFFFAFLVSFYYRRIRKIARQTWRPWLFAALAMLIFTPFCCWVWPKYEEHSLNNLPPPWQGVAIQEYQDPRAATETILHTLIANGLLGVSVDVRNLTAIQNEVAFPVPEAEYTPGMKYAQKTYGLDGWGREFSYKQIEDRQYRIASAGPDGIFDTEDDIVFVVPPVNGGWEQCISGMYYRVVEGRAVLLIHQIDDSLFKAAHPTDAKKITGTDLFDSFHIEELESKNSSTAKNEPPLFEAIVNWQKSKPAASKTDDLLFACFEDSRHE